MMPDLKTSLAITTMIERWSYSPTIDVSLRSSEVTSRGVSTWLDREREAAAPCGRRIFIATIEARVIALDAVIAFALP
jgi:quinoprotein glucose dehydrogenase